MRIDKYISELGIASRKEASGVARKGGVLVNGAPVKDLSAHIDPDKDKIIGFWRERFESAPMPEERSEGYEMPQM